MVRNGDCDHGAERGLSPMSSSYDYGAERQFCFRSAAKGYPVPSVLFVPSAPYRASGGPSARPRGSGALAASNRLSAGGSRSRATAIRSTDARGYPL